MNNEKPKKIGNISSSIKQINDAIHSYWKTIIIYAAFLSLIYNISYWFIAFRINIIPYADLWDFIKSFITPLIIFLAILFLLIFVCMIFLTIILGIIAYIIHIKAYCIRHIKPKIKSTPANHNNLVTISVYADKSNKLTDAISVAKKILTDPLCVRGFIVLSMTANIGSVIFLFISTQYIFVKFLLLAFISGYIFLIWPLLIEAVSGNSFNSRPLIDKIYILLLPMSFLMPVVAADIVASVTHKYGAYTFIYQCKNKRCSNIKAKYIGKINKYAFFIAEKGHEKFIINTDKEKRIILYSDH